ncbi:acyl-CoA dehydrogenase [Antarcticimicrobium sediminis]|uniref:3-methylmercaptopropionyl-CoA dehydrogenase n=1 Tax=Antarcticimicrobium sediminis TaxID=2546227 RepID=A0A4V2Z8K3_9RHOB|nr:acyl-CoA dehydrogenase [Antarcticimicrobium sediminis]TDE40716.1 acyl-CoA dehydrogenase [Antarcticimicrobium sediminis]
MTFNAPVRDLLFNIEHLSGWPDIAGLPRHAGLELDDVSAVLEEFGRFCAEKIAPLNAPGDRAASRFENGKVVLPDGFTEAYAQFVEMGWQGLQHPEAFGGQDLPRAVGAAATEILNAANMSFALCPLLTDGAIEALLTAGSEAQKATYLEPLVSGRWTGTMNLTEPQAGSDLALVRSRAERQENGSYRITGTKIFITYGEHDMAENTVHLVLARTPDAPAGVKGISLFLVPKYPVEADGTFGPRNAVRCVSVEHKLGVKASPTAVLEYEGATGFLIGEENCGLDYMFVMMNAARYAVGIQGIAIAERARQQALAYARDRVQSRPVDGSSREAVSIIRHPDVRRLLLRMRALTEAGRAMAATTAGWQELAHHGETPETRAEASALAEFMVPLVKGYCTEMGVEVASIGVQVHGGMGFIEETGAAQHYRDARILPIYEGTTAIQANDLLGRKTLRDGGATARRLAARIAQTEAELSAASPVAQAVGARLATARGAFEAAVDHLCSIGRSDPNAAYGASVPYLMLAGNLMAGWQLARSLLVAEAALARGEETEFMAAKIATARFYGDHILPETETQRLRITEGAESLLDAVL